MKKYIAECIGTFVLTFLGCGAAVSLSCGTDTASVVGTAIAFGLSVVAMAYTIGGISGCHINPAITLGCLVTGRISCKDSIGYIVGQVIGGIIAGAALYALYPGSGLGANGIGAGCNGCWCIALTVEIILTALFVLVVLGATHKTNGATGNYAGLAIGLSLILIHLVGIYFTGTSVNPARSIGPAIFACGDALHNLWIFIAGPFVGALIAAVLWKVVEPKEK
jgi:aquaporin Z